MRPFGVLRRCFYYQKQASKKNNAVQDTYATGKPLLHTGFNLAYNSSVSQEGVFTEIRPGSKALVTMVV